MAEEKVIFIIPGFKHNPKNKAYKEIAKLLKREGYHPILITIPWRKTTISQNSEYFLKEYNKRLLLRNKQSFSANKKICRKKIYILGFSFGAMIALLASTKVSISGLILCSLSPYFKEDLSKADNGFLSSITTQRYQDFLNLHCATLAKQIKAKQVLMLYGTKEERSLKKRVTEAYDQIAFSNKYLIPIKKTEHDIGDKKYLNKIHQIARKLKNVN